MLSVAIVGGSGYVGGEVLRLVLGHPELEAASVTSTRLSGRYVASVHPNLRGQTKLQFVTESQLDSVDVLFLCLPHGEAALRIDEYSSKAKFIVDCSADFRIRDGDQHSLWYGESTIAAEWRSQFAYGLPETQRSRLRESRYISGVGCNATAINLALLPLARNGWIDKVIADVKVGSSEGGAKSSEASHHPERSGAVRSFAPAGHRHQGEVCQELDLHPESLFMSVTSIEMVRGALATCHVFVNQELTDKDLWKAFRESYGDEPFVRVVKEKTGLYRLPEPKILSGSNFCDVGWALDDHGRRVVVVSALDNMMKGAAGSAIQSLNIACGFPETTGLTFTGLHPI